MKIIPYDDRFLTRLTKINFEPCYKELICDYDISELVLSFRFDYDTYKSYIIISNSHIEYALETPKIAVSLGTNYDTAVVCAGNQQQIDLWFKILKESLEWYLLTFFCKDNIEIKMQDTCIYKGKLCFSHKFSDNDKFFFIAHPYLKENYPKIYKCTKETEYPNLEEMDFFEFKKRYIEFTKKHNLIYPQK